jgi:glucose-1-phosphatase
MDEDGVQTPMVLPVTIDGLTANADGLYSLTDLDARMAEAMAEYDAIEDVATAVSVQRTVPVNSAHTYTLRGTMAIDSSRGVIIKQEQKAIKN